jgi:nicotinamidase-related amidase
MSEVKKDNCTGAGACDLLDPSNCCVIFIDHQPAMTAGVQSIDRQTLLNNTVGLAKACTAFKIPTILTAVESKGFSGNIWPQLQQALPKNNIIERSSMNSWEDEAFVKAVKETKKKKLVICALWTEVCLTFPALSALKEGFEVYAVEDCSGGVSTIAHDCAMRRMEQAGVRPVTWIQVMLEFQRDWSRKGTYNDVMTIVLDHGGAYGQSVEYAYTMVHKAPDYTQRLKAQVSGDAAKH